MVSQWTGRERIKARWERGKKFLLPFHQSYTPTSSSLIPLNAFLPLPVLSLSLSPSFFSSLFPSFPEPEPERRPETRYNYSFPSFGKRETFEPSGKVREEILSLTLFILSFTFSLSLESAFHQHRIQLHYYF